MNEYIERDKIQAVFDGISDCADMVFEPNDRCCTEDDCGGCKWFLTKKAIEKEVMAIPAADVRPVVRGKWLQDCGYHFRCSVCGDRWTVSNGNPLDLSNGWNYCPNCGADMRSEPPEE